MKDTYVKSYELNGIIFQRREAAAFGNLGWYGCGDNLLHERYLKILNAKIHNAKIHSVWNGKEILTVGDQLFDKNGNYLGVVDSLDFNTEFMFSISILNQTTKITKFYDSVFTLKQLAKREGLEVGIKLHGELLNDWDYSSLKKGYTFSSCKYYNIQGLEIGCRGNTPSIYNKPLFVINGASLPIIGFKKFKEEWEANGKHLFRAEDFKCGKLPVIEFECLGDMVEKGDTIYMADQFQIMRILDVQTEIKPTDPKGKFFFSSDNALAYHKSLNK